MISPGRCENYCGEKEYSLEEELGAVELGMHENADSG